MREPDLSHALPTSKLQQPNLLQFVRSLIEQDLNSSCRRQFCRHSVRVTLSIQPLTSDFRPDGDGFSAMSSDISLKGMAFVNPEALVHEFVRISFSQFGISAIARVRHNSSVGIDHPLFLVGVEFLDEYYQG